MGIPGSIRYLVACASMCIALSSVHAAEVGGVKLDDRVSADGHELVLNGAGVRTRFVIKVYVGALYLPAKTTNAADVLGKDQPRRITLVLLRDLSADQITEAFEQGITANNTASELEAVKDGVNQLRGIFQTMREAKSGQVITIDYAPARGTQVSIDKTQLGRIPGEAFNRALLKAWLGDKPVQESLKSAMLGAS